MRPLLSDASLFCQVDIILARIHALHISSTKHKFLGVFYQNENVKVQRQQVTHFSPSSLAGMLSITPYQPITTLLLVNAQLSESTGAAQAPPPPSSPIFILQSSEFQNQKTAQSHPHQNDGLCLHPCV